MPHRERPPTWPWPSRFERFFAVPPEVSIGVSTAVLLVAIIIWSLIIYGTR